MIFASTILDNIKKNDSNFPFSIKEGVLLITTSGLISGWFGIIPAKYFGRKRILVISHAIFTIEHAIIGIFAYNEWYRAMYVSVLIFVSTFYLSANNVVFLYLGEVCVDQAMGVVLGAVWFFGIVLSYLVSYMIDSPLGTEWTFGVYAISNALTTVYCLFLKETKGLTPI